MKHRLTILSIFISSIACAQFHPTDVSDLTFFVESKVIDINNHVAFCETDNCLTHTNTEGAPIIEQYCDVSNSCTDGCVRRWQDLSSYIPSGGFNPPEYTSGRNFGQDDSEKPCYIPNCINGEPCIRGGGPYGDFGQDKYLEIQIADFINLPNEFSIFLLAKPIDQTTTGEWFYFGQSNSFLRHDVVNNKLKLRVPGNLVTSISSNNSIQLNSWQLIEIHRDSGNLITTFVNGIETSINNIILSGNFTIGYLFSNFKTTGQFNQTAMYGDIASFLVYTKKTSLAENIDIRNYFNTNYLGNVLSVNSSIVKESLIYPNPFTNEFQITKSKAVLGAKPKLFNSYGQEIELKIKEETTNTIKLALAEEATNGIYFLKIKNNIIKIVKE